MIDRPLVLVEDWSVVLPSEEYRDRLRGAHRGVRVEFFATPDELATRLPEADGLVTRQPLSTELLAGAIRLRWVHSIPAGVDRVLTPALRAAVQIAVTSSKGPMGTPMAEHAVALLLALARRLREFGRQQDAHEWRTITPMVEMADKTVAVLGVGAVGGHMARICGAGFGMRVLGLARTRRDNPHVDRYFERADLHAALAEADAVLLALALTPETARIIDGPALAAMKPTAFLVNVARGGLVDGEALVDALRAGRIAGAGLDAPPGEPLPPDHPLWGLPNAIITPHNAPQTDRWLDHLVEFWRENIRRFAEGRPPLGAVDREAGY